MATTTRSTAQALPQTSAIVAVPASGPGALAGFEAVCECGLVMRSSLETIIRQDVFDHVRWHQARGR